jgi:hypothetical protein
MNFLYKNIIFTNWHCSLIRCPSRLLRSFDCRFLRLSIGFYRIRYIGLNFQSGSSGFIGIYRNRWKLLGFSDCSKPLFTSFSIQHAAIGCPLFHSLLNPLWRFSFGFITNYSEFYWNPGNHLAEITTVCWF